MHPLMEAEQPDEGKILAQIDAIAQARAELEKANARMLLGIRQVLTPDQWTKLKAMREEKAQEWGRDGRGMRDRSKKLISDFLLRHPKDRHILIAAANDSSALGAVDAVREQKRERSVAIVGQDCIADAVTEMRRERSPLIGSVSHQTNSYGPSLIHLGLSLLKGQTVPPYNYVAHRMVTRESLQ